MNLLNGDVTPRDCPYFGLNYYEQRFGAWFFGRDAECNKIITNMQAARLTLLHAESGVGKSSLLRAGVAAQLSELAKSERQQDGACAIDLPVVFSSWRDDPVEGLVATISEAIEPFVSENSKVASGSLDLTIRAAAAAANASLLILFDQFEEYFLYHSDEQSLDMPGDDKPASACFAEALARCINCTDLNANFLIAIRDNAYASLDGMFKGRIENI
jgi:hypothetical protein